MLRDEWPLAGRSEELAVLEEQVVADAGVAIAGVAGVGKSRLARELLKVLEGRGWSVRRAYATPSAAAIPLGAIAPLVPQIGHGPADGLSMLQRARAELAGDRVVVAVDDAQWLDDLSAVLVHQLASAGDAKVVMTLRTGTPLPDPLAALIKDDVVRRLELQALSPRETDRLTMSVLDGGVETATLVRLRELSGGNALYLREAVLAGTESGALQPVDGMWTWLPGARASPSLRDLLTARLADVPAAEMRALEILALGEPLDVDDLAALVSGTALASLERRRLVEEVADEGRRVVRLVHPLYGEALRASIAPRDAEVARRALVDLLSQSSFTADVLRAAVLHLEADTRDRPDLLRAGAALANLSTDWVLGERLARAAHDFESTRESAIQLGAAVREQGRFDEAVAIAEPFLEDASGRLDPLVAVEVANTLFAGLDRPHEAAEILARAADDAPDLVTRQRIEAVRTSVLSNIGRADESLELNQTALEHPDLDARALTGHLMMAATILTARGRPLDALELFDTHGAKLWTVDDEGRSDVALALAVQLLGMAFDGRTDEIEALVVPLYEAAVRTGDHNGRHLAGHALAHLAAWRGTPRTGLRYSSEVVPLFARRGQYGRRDWLLAFHAQSLALLGRADEAIAAARAASEVTFRNGKRFYHSEIGRATAWTLWAAGDASAARRTAIAAADDALEAGWDAFEMLALYDAVRLGASEVSARLADTAGRLQGRVASAIATHAVGLRTADGTTLDAASRMLEEAGWILCGAEASAQAAALHHEDGRRAAATASGERSAALAATCEGARTPILLAGTRPDPLTRREREVALLAATGLSNREIAERLVTSVRTVEGHLNRAFAKLGVGTRAELSAVMAPHP